MPSLKDIWLGTAPKMEKVPTGTQQQGQFNEQLLSQLMQQLQGGGGYGQSQDWMASLFGPEAFQKFSEPYNQQFQQQFQQDLMPRIAERFAGFGNSSGALSSTGFGQALGGAAAQGSSNLQAQLAQLFSQLQQGAAGQFSNQFQNQTQQAQGYQPFAYLQKPGTTGAGIQFMNALGAGAAGGIGGM